MKLAHICNMAMNELLRKIEVEQERVNTTNLKVIAQARLERYYSEERELHQLILDAEKEGL